MPPGTCEEADGTRGNGGLGATLGSEDERVKDDFAERVKDDFARDVWSLSVTVKQLTEPSRLSALFASSLQKRACANSRSIFLDRGANSSRSEKCVFRASWARSWSARYVVVAQKGRCGIGRSTKYPGLLVVTPVAHEADALSGIGRSSETRSAEELKALPAVDLNLCCCGVPTGDAEGSERGSAGFPRQF